MGKFEDGFGKAMGEGVAEIVLTIILLWIIFSIL